MLQISFIRRSDESQVRHSGLQTRIFQQDEVFPTAHFDGDFEQEVQGMNSLILSIRENSTGTSDNLLWTLYQTHQHWNSGWERMWSLLFICFYCFHFIHRFSYKTIFCNHETERRTMYVDNPNTARQRINSRWFSKFGCGLLIRVFHFIQIIQVRISITRLSVTTAMTWILMRKSSIVVCPRYHVKTSINKQC